MESKNLNLTPLLNAKAAFEEVLASEADLVGQFYKIYRAATIQHFEFCFELATKFMKRWLEQNHTESLDKMFTVKDIYRLGAMHDLLQSAERWFVYRDMRNKTSHTYNETTAEQVFQETADFYTDFCYLIDRLSERL